MFGVIIVGGLNVQQTNPSIAKIPHLLLTLAFKMSWHCIRQLTVDIVNLKKITMVENRENQQESRGRSSNRGFASMDPQKQREIASAGGRAAHRQGVAHEWTSEEARAAGRKGGQNSRGGGRSRNRSENEESGRESDR